MQLSHEHLRAIMIRMWEREREREKLFIWIQWYIKSKASHLTRETSILNTKQTKSKTEEASAASHCTNRKYKLNKRWTRHICFSNLIMSSFFYSYPFWIIVLKTEADLIPLFPTPPSVICLSLSLSYIRRRNPLSTFYLKKKELNCVSSYPRLYALFTIFHSS